MDAQTCRPFAQTSSRDGAEGEVEAVERARMIFARLRREARASLLGMERDGLVTFSAEPLFPPLFSFAEERDPPSSTAPAP